MKIINKNWQRKIEIEDNIIYTLVFENKKYFSPFFRIYK